MRYYKTINGDCLLTIGTGSSGEEITQKEYYHILSVIRCAPTAEDGYQYRLKADLTWELVEAPAVEEDTDATEADYLEALAELGVTVNEKI